mgnify:CR=1 FL=1
MKTRKNRDFPDDVHAGLPARSMRSMRKQHFRLPPWRRRPTADEAAPDIADSELVPSESAAQPTRRKHGINKHLYL